MLRKHGVSRKLLGIKSIEEGYVVREDDTELYFFKTQPYNLAVLSDDVIIGKVEAFTEILKVMDEISILCLDGAEDFSDNKNFLMRRIVNEKNPVIKQLLQMDLEDVRKLQQNINTSRAFILSFRIMPHKKKEDLVKLAHLVSNARDTGIMISQYTQDELKRLFMMYYKQDATEDINISIDGEQYFVAI